MKTIKNSDISEMMKLRANSIDTNYQEFLRGKMSVLIYLKQSAIEDIKELQKEDNKTKSGDIQITERAGVIKYIKKKFNVTEEDLK